MDLIVWRNTAGDVLASTDSATQLELVISFVDDGLTGFICQLTGYSGGGVVVTLPVSPIGEQFLPMQLYSLAEINPWQGLQGLTHKISRSVLLIALLIIVCAHFGALVT